jgi:chitin disaccharide deacetylase
MRERLPPGLIVNADDLAIHPRINAGILSAWRGGILTSATMLMTTPYLDETMGVLRDGGPPVGIHLALTLGKAVAPRRDVPDLTDDEGHFIWSSYRLLLRSYADEAGRRLLGQIRREFEAQLGLARDYGITAVHADSHQHVHMNPAIFAQLEELLPRFGMDRVRLSREAIAARPVAELLTQGKPINLAKVALLRWLARSIQPRLATTDEFFGVLHSGVATKAAVMTAIRHLRPDRSLEICIHPGFPAPPGEAPYRHADVNAWITAPLRQAEHDALVDAEIAALVRQRGIRLRDFDGREKQI